MDRPATAREIILEILRNMREGLEPLHFSTLPPSVFYVYLHTDDMERLRAIVPKIADEARRALDAELASMRKSSIAERLKLAKPMPPVASPDGGWQITILENTDDEVAPGDIVIHSELALPAKTDLGAGSMTKRIATRRFGGADSTSQTYAPAAAPLQVAIAASTGPSGATTATMPVPLTGDGACAVIEYEDSGGHKTFRMTKEQIVVGRGGRDYWTDLKLDTIPDVSREHFRLRRDPASGQFFLKDLSRLGTTINGEAVPSSIELDNGEKRDRNIETPVPSQARIGLAGAIYLEFRSTASE